MSKPTTLDSARLESARLELARLAPFQGAMIVSSLVFLVSMVAMGVIFARHAASYSQIVSMLGKEVLPLTILGCGSFVTLAVASNKLFNKRIQIAKGVDNEREPQQEPQKVRVRLRLNSQILPANLERGGITAPIAEQQGGTSWLNQEVVLAPEAAALVERVIHQQENLGSIKSEKEALKALCDSLVSAAQAFYASFCKYWKVTPDPNFNKLCEVIRKELIEDFEDEVVALALSLSGKYKFSDISPTSKPLYVYRDDMVRLIATALNLKQNEKADKILKELEGRLAHKQLVMAREVVEQYKLQKKDIRACSQELSKLLPAYVKPFYLLSTLRDGVNELRLSKTPISTIFAGIGENHLISQFMKHAKLNGKNPIKDLMTALERHHSQLFDWHSKHLKLSDMSVKDVYGKLEKELGQDNVQKNEIYRLLKALEQTQVIKDSDTIKAVVDSFADSLKLIETVPINTLLAGLPENHAFFISQFMEHAKLNGKSQIKELMDALEKHHCQDNNTKLDRILDWYATQHGLSDIDVSRLYLMFETQLGQNVQKNEIYRLLKELELNKVIQGSDKMGAVVASFKSYRRIIDFISILQSQDKNVPIETVIKGLQTRRDEDRFYHDVEIDAPTSWKLSAEIISILDKLLEQNAFGTQFFQVARIIHIFMNGEMHTAESVKNNDGFAALQLEEITFNNTHKSQQRVALLFKGARQDLLTRLVACTEGGLQTFEPNNAYQAISANAYPFQELPDPMGLGKIVGNRHSLPTSIPRDKTSKELLKWVKCPHDTVNKWYAGSLGMEGARAGLAVEKTTILNRLQEAFNSVSMLDGLAILDLPIHFQGTPLSLDSNRSNQKILTLVDDYMDEYLEVYPRKYRDLVNLLGADRRYSQWKEAESPSRDFMQVEATKALFDVMNMKDASKRSAQLQKIQPDPYPKFNELLTILKEGGAPDKLRAIRDDLDTPTDIQFLIGSLLKEHVNWHQQYAKLASEIPDGHLKELAAILSKKENQTAELRKLWNRTTDKQIITLLTMILTEKAYAHTRELVGHLVEPFFFGLIYPGRVFVGNPFKSHVQKVTLSLSKELKKALQNPALYKTGADGQEKVDIRLLFLVLAKHFGQFAAGMSVQ